ncbi:MAG: S-methyl-5'-thioadenosine phosphorylase [Deltaproteobacteria bacterium]|nr:MAG: S-methyl-5'-thioadenosine phosphorylase [Deltaproteobacteria bacterium]
MPRIGILGGSGLYDMPGLKDRREERVDTPFGSPSDAILLGDLDGETLAFLPRHGRGHRFNPSEVNYRANVWALRKLGVEWIISVSAVGSLREEVVPGHVVVIDQFIDRTKGRHATFFEGGVVGHIAFADPVCSTLRGFLLQAANEAGATVHDGGTYVCMEGPAFSTRAESHLYRSWGGKVIGMTNLPEAKLAREAGISYATLAMATDYDCWHEAHDAVTVDQVVATLKKNVALAQRAVAHAVPLILSHAGPCPASRAAEGAIMTDPSKIPTDRREALAVIAGQFLG